MHPKETDNGINKLLTFQTASNKELGRKYPSRLERVLTTDGLEKHMFL